MPATSTKTTSTSGKNKTRDPFALLAADHKAVKALFKQFDDLADQEDVDEQKSGLVGRICAHLSIHASLEEEIFYPALRTAIEDDALMDEADVEHASAKDLIAQLEGMEPGDEYYDARVTVLGEYIDHHVKEEEGEMFAKARRADLDVEELGERMAARKDELLAEFDLAEEDEAAAPSAKPARTSPDRRR